jgi:hypothetical protein
MALPDYGSTMTPIEPKDRSFDPNNTYYLKEASLTPAQRWRKIMLLSVPIIAALLVFGGAALFLLKDSGILSPGSARGSGERTVTSTVRVRDRPEDSGNAPAPHAPTIHKKKTAQPSTRIDAAAAACSAHKACSALIGDCCPSEGGIFLECCN